MAGNITLYDMNTDNVAKMIEGQFLPQPVTSLALVLAVTYIGTKNLPKDWLKSTFRVRRDVVFNALTWLKSHNPLYADIQISEAQLAHLPEDDVPQEIISVICHEANDDIATQESKGYVPADDEIRNDACCSNNEHHHSTCWNLLDEDISNVENDSEGYSLEEDSGNSHGKNLNKF